MRILSAEMQGSEFLFCRANILSDSLRPPHTSRFFVGRQKIFTCRLVCGGPRQFVGALSRLNRL